MKKKPLSLLLALSASVTLNLANAATTGTLTFRGDIQGGTCALAAGDVNRTITLPTVKVSDFDSVVFTGGIDFTLTASCDSDIKNVIFSFAGTPATLDPARFANTGTAAGLGMVLQARNGPNYNIPANGSAAQRQRTVATTAGAAALPMSAYYYKHANVGKGSFASAATVSITYN